MSNYGHYTMAEQLKKAYQANQEITTYLESWPNTIEVINVENDKEFQKKDIDNIWRFMQDGKEVTWYIEVKGDTVYGPGNYFIETVSNAKKNTPGCFLYSEADYFFYYFLEVKQLHVIPLLPAREWFLKHQDEFEERKPNTDGNYGNHFYESKGSLVPRERMIREVKGIKVIDIGKYLTEKVA